MNTIDCLSAVILGYSLLTGTLQGFTREILRIATWSGATTIAYHKYSLLEPFLSPFVTKPVFLKAVCMAVMFIGVLISCNMFSHHLSYRIRKGVLKGVDGGLGLLLGGIRGILILMSAYALFLSFNLSGRHFEAIDHSKAVPLIEGAFIKANATFASPVLKKLALLIKEKNTKTPSVPSVPKQQGYSASPAVQNSAHRPVSRKSASSYIKEIFDFLHIDDEAPVVPLKKPVYSPHERNTLDALISEQEKHHDKAL